MTYRFGAGFVEAVKVRGLTAQRLAHLASVSPATVAAALHGRDVQIGTALKIADAVKRIPVEVALEQWSEGVDT